MPETTPLIKAALNLRVGAGFDVYEYKKPIAVKNIFDQFGAEEIEKFGHEVISALHSTDG